MNEFQSSLSAGAYNWNALERKGFWFGSIFGLSLLVLYSLHMVSIVPIALLAGVVIVFFALGLNFNATIIFFCLSFFIEFFFFSLAVAEWMACFVLISFFLTHKVSEVNFRNAYLKAYFVYLISIIPSYFMISFQPATFLFLFRYVGFLSVLAIFPIAFERIEKMKIFFTFFIVCAVINVFTMIGEGGLSGHRVFGIAGIMFVDLVGIAIALAYTHVLFRRNQTGLMIVFLAILLLGAFMTQTRNSWIAIFLTLVYCSWQFIKRSGKFDFSAIRAKARVAKFVFGVVFFIGFAFIVTPSTLDRFAQKKVTTDNERFLIDHVDSFTSRIFIWHTAFNAFTAHPIFGIGNYNFPSVSENYNTLPLYVYGVFVMGRRPHLVLMELLSETGIVGFLGYLFFMVYTWRRANKILQYKGSQTDYFLSLSVVGCLFYLTISMLMTDAWLWGQLQMLHACVLAGLVIIENHHKQGFQLQEAASE